MEKVAEKECTIPLLSQPSSLCGPLNIFWYVSSSVHRLFSLFHGFLVVWWILGYPQTPCILLSLCTEWGYIVVIAHVSEHTTVTNRIYCHLTCVRWGSIIAILLLVKRDKGLVMGCPQHDAGQGEKPPALYRRVLDYFLHCSYHPQTSSWRWSE